MIRASNSGGKSFGNVIEFPKVPPDLVPGQPPRNRLKLCAPCCHPEYPVPGVPLTHIANHGNTGPFPDTSTQFGLLAPQLIWEMTTPTASSIFRGMGTEDRGRALGEREPVPILLGIRFQQFDYCQTNRMILELGNGYRRAACLGRLGAAELHLPHCLSAGSALLLRINKSAGAQNANHERVD
jgi:hypothetical protein